MNKEIVTYMEGIATDFFKSWPIESTVKISTEEDSVLKIEIETDKNDIFTKPGHDPLLAVQHILRLAVRKQFPAEFVRVVVDIGGFHKEQQASLRKLAQDAIDKVLTNKELLHLSPMSSFERRVIHVVVAENGKVVSESAGAGADRHVVIKPSV